MKNPTNALIHGFNIQQLYALPILYLFQNKQRRMLLKPSQVKVLTGGRRLAPSASRHPPFC